MHPPVPILYVENIAEVIGGGPMSLLTLTENLDRSRFRPIVVCYAAGGLPDRLSDSGVEVYVVEHRGALSSPRVVLKLARLFRRRNVRLVHVNSLDIRAGLAAKLSGVPLIGHLRVIFPFTWVDRLFASLATCIISVSEAAREVFCRRHKQLITKFVTIPNSVSVKGVTSPFDIRSELGLPPETPLVASVSRIDPVKDLHTFIRTAARVKTRIPNAKFLLLGAADTTDPESCAYENGLRPLAYELGLANDLFFLGFRHDALGIMKQVDIVAVTSAVLKSASGIRAEGFGRVIVEAMALGVPVVATKTGGIHEIVEHGDSGLLVPAGMPEEMAGAVVSLIQDRLLREKIIRKGKQRFQDRYHIDRHMASVQGLYEEVLQTHG